jgi:hypothetical protein
MPFILDTNAYKIFVVKPEWTRPLERPRSRWGKILKLILKELDSVRRNELNRFRISSSGGLLQTW